ncbi:MAG: hypothetical protein HY764_03430 [Candidatus Portnoybacteria bacterium]|nr:hypothetical protein [Candidatus Portnoybacteria bacterium]
MKLAVSGGIQSVGGKIMGDSFDIIPDDPMAPVVLYLHPGEHLEVAYELDGRGAKKCIFIDENSNLVMANKFPGQD